MDVGHRGTYVALGRRALQRPRGGGVAASASGPSSSSPTVTPPTTSRRCGSGTRDDLAIAPLRDSLLTRAANRRMGTPTDDRARRPWGTSTRAVEREGGQLRFAHRPRRHARVRGAAGPVGPPPLPRPRRPRVRCWASCGGPVATHSRRGSTSARSRWTRASYAAMELVGRPDVMEPPGRLAGRVGAGPADAGGDPDQLGDGARHGAPSPTRRGTCAAAPRWRASG